MDKKFNKNHEKSAETQEGFAKRSFAKIAGIGAIVVAAGTLLTACSSNEKSAKNSADNAPKTAQSAKNAESSESESSLENQNGLKISFSEFKSELENAGYTINSAEITTDSAGKEYYAMVKIPNGATGYVNFDPYGWGINGEPSNVLVAAKDAGFLFD